MNAGDAFSSAVMRAYDERLAVSELMPALLAQACVDVLPIDGAGLSLTDDLRVPLGSSDEIVAQAERLQTTLGEGPCLTATTRGKAVIVDLAAIENMWPMFHRGLLAQTPFRSIASLPLSSPEHERFGALDLYSVDPGALPFQAIEGEIKNIADQISWILFEEPSGHRHGIATSAWLNNSAVRNRMNVWVAVGILIEHAHLSNIDALATLRAYAFSHNASLDDIADQTTTRRLEPAALLA